MNYKKILYGVSAVFTAGYLLVGDSIISPMDHVYAKTAAATDTDNGSDKEVVKDGEGKIYCVGSVSKVYVTAAVMMLVEEEKIELDNPVTDYIPEFKMADDRYKDITIRMLMDHTSGLMGSSFKDTFLYDDNDMYHHDNLLKLLSDQRLKADPGEYACYCNDGFDLLDLVVERVSGMAYTDYVTDVMGKKMNVDHTGTSLNMIGEYESAPVYRKGNIEYATICTKATGAGGVYATAKDTARFGTVFYKDDNTLLGEGSKVGMATRWNDKDADKDEYTADSGLGWDYVEELKYKKAGVKVLGKGGDAIDNHAMLIVAPDEKISVAVLSSGGNSSLNGAMAEALLDTVLKDRGIEVSDPVAGDVTLSDSIPQEYEEYAGYYVISRGMSQNDIWNISFNEGYMDVEESGMYRNESLKYRYSEDGKFCRVDDYDNTVMDGETISFVRHSDGNIYIKEDVLQIMQGMGNRAMSMYVGQRIEDNTVSSDVIKKWAGYENRKFALFDNRYSSGFYETPFFTCKVAEGLQGYVFVGSEESYALEKIASGDEAKAFLTIPGDASRDIYDVKLSENVNVHDGIYNVVDLQSRGLKCLDVDMAPSLTSDINEVKLVSDEAAWYRLDGDVSNTTIAVDKPSESSVFVYNKFGEMVYTTLMKGGNGDIPLPKDGYIVFVGETGETVAIGR
ncbi:MAG: beta-lactamase family protein [Lachnospiraceae bacterium]|nr:beta-lactamase family protein [Lachnospiraceae bacterium]